MLFVMASLGLPGLGNFVGEFLVLMGVFQTSPVTSILGTAGLVFATIYSLAIIQRAFHGEQSERWHPNDLTVREMSILGVMIVVIVWLGLYPQPVFGTVLPALQQLIASTAG